MSMKFEVESEGLEIHTHPLRHSFWGRDSSREPYSRSSTVKKTSECWFVGILEKWVGVLMEKSSVFKPNIPSLHCSIVPLFHSSIVISVVSLDLQTESRSFVCPDLKQRPLLLLSLRQE